MFQFPGLAPPLRKVTGFSPAGFPHSDISGSKPACGSPKLFAACHVLLRRSVPRHPPCALLRLTSILSPLVSTLVDTSFFFLLSDWTALSNSIHSHLLTRTPCKLQALHLGALFSLPSTLASALIPLAHIRSGNSHFQAETSVK